jgi:membrane protein
VLRKTAREFSKDQCTDLAAALTYYAVLALFRL